MNCDFIIKYLDDFKIAYYINQPNVFSRTKNYLVTINFNKNKSIDFVTFSHHNENTNRHLSLLLGLKKKDDLKLLNILEMLNIDLKEYAEKNKYYKRNIDYYNIITYKDLHNFLDFKNISYSIFSNHNKKDKDVFIEMNNNCVFEIYFQNNEIKYYSIYNKDFSEINNLINDNMQHCISKLNTLNKEFLSIEEILYIIFSRRW